MISFLFGLINIVHSWDYALNTNEIKVIDKYIDGIEKYDSLKYKYQAFDLGIELKDETISQVVSLFMPFDEWQRVDVLTSASNVYTIFYDKELEQTKAPSIQTLTGVSNCTSITYFNDQFIVLCQEPIQQFILQNGSKISYINDLDNLTQIQGFYDGLVGIAENQIIFFNENLELEKSINLQYIQVIITKSAIFILSDTEVYIYEQAGYLSFAHRCQKTPEFMAIDYDNIYVQCDTIHILGDQIEITDIIAASITTTNLYVIINGTEVYDSNLENQYFNASSQLYPTFDNQVLTINQNKIYIYEIFGLYIIQSKEEGQLSLPQGEIIIVGDGLQNLNLETPDFTSGEQLFYVDYLAGPDITIVKGGKPLESYKKTITKKVLTAFTIQEKGVGVVYQEEKNLFLTVCQVQINNSLLKTPCIENVQFESNFPTTIQKIDSVFLIFEKATLIGYLSNNILTLYFNDQKLNQFTDVIDFELSIYGIFVVIEKSKTTVYDINSKSYNKELELGINCIGATIFWKNIALITADNDLIIITASLNGWYESFGAIFSDAELILNVNYVNGQLIVSTGSQLYIFQGGVLRGVIQHNVKGKLQFAQTQSNLYIYNETNVFDFQIYEEISFSTFLQQIIDIKSQQTFLALSYNNLQLLLIDNQLIVDYDILGFIPSTIVEQDTYGHQTLIDVDFSNRLNQNASLKVKIVGDTLKLQSLECNDTLSNKISQNTIFFGPISSIEGSNKTQVIQRVTEKVNQSQWLKQNIQDLIYIGNSEQVAIINGNEIKLCNEKDCKNITQAKENCQFLEQDEQTFYCACGSFIYSGSKSNPSQISNVQFAPKSNSIEIMRFNGSYLATAETIEDILTLVIYENFKMRASKAILNLQDFEFNGKNILVLTYNQIIVFDTDLVEQYTFDLLKDLSSQVQNNMLLYSFFVDFVKVKDDQYIVATNDSPLYKVYLHPDYVEIMQIFTNIPDSYTFSVDLIGQDILVSTSTLKNQKYLSFYDLTSQFKSTSIIPYFNVVQISKFFTQTNSIRQSNEFQLVLVVDELKEYNINAYFTILGGQEQTELIAYDLQNQQAKTLVKIKTVTSETEESEDWMIAIYILGGVVGLLILFILVRYIRRYCLMKHLKFVEEKPSEFKSEYI